MDRIGSDYGIRSGRQFALNSKLLIESDCLLVVVRLWGTRLKQIGARRLLVNENNVSDTWRGHSLNDNKFPLSYLAHVRDFLNRLLWKEAFNLCSVQNKTNSEESRDGKKTQNQCIERYLHLSPIRHLRFGWCHVTKPQSYKVMQQKISQCSSVENNSLRWFSSWWWILSLVIHEKRFFFTRLGRNNPSWTGC